MTTPKKCECEGCTCGANDHISRVSGTSRHVNKEIPHFHYMDKDGNTHIGTTDGELSTVETNAVERLVEEHRQLEMFAADPTYGDMFPEKFELIIEDLQDGDTVEES